MINYWRGLPMFAILTAAALTIAPPSASAGGDKAPTLEEVNKTLQRLVDRVGALESKKLSKAEEDALAMIFRTELLKLETGILSELKKNVDKLGTDVAALQSEQAKQKAQLDAYKVLVDEMHKKLLLGAPSGSPAIDKAFMDELRAQFKMLNETLAKYGPTEKRVSAYGNGATTGAGRVMFVNMYNDDLLLILNGTPYRIPARSTRTVEGIPAGMLRYEIFSDRWGILERQAIPLAGGDTFTLTASR